MHRADAFRPGADSMRPEKKVFLLIHSVYRDHCQEGGR